MTKSESGGKAVKSISIMAVLILLAKFMGLFREMLIAGFMVRAMLPMLSTARPKFRFYFLIWCWAWQFYPPLFRFITKI